MQKVPLNVLTFRALVSYERKTHHASYFSYVLNDKLTDFYSHNKFTSPTTFENTAMNEKINYLEFPAKDLEVTKTFFSSAFGWSFIDYGPEYSAFENAGIDGGFFKTTLYSSTANGSALAVLYSDKLENTKEQIEKVGGKIVKEIFSFPGGRRFHFSDPNGNEFAVWSDKE